MNEFIQHLEELLEVKAGTLKANTPLTQISSWDSMGAVGFLALADGTYGRAVSPAAIQKATTVGDLAALVGQA
jgi:acyl carrier protein